MVRAAFTLQRRNKDIAEERVNRMSDNVGLPWRLRPPEIYSIIGEDETELLEKKDSCFSLFYFKFSSTNLQLH